MTKAELVDFIAEKADLTKADAARALEAVMEGVTAGLKETGAIVINTTHDNEFLKKSIVNGQESQYNVAVEVFHFTSCKSGKPGTARTGKGKDLPCSALGIWSCIPCTAQASSMISFGKKLREFCRNTMSSRCPWAGWF